MSVTTNVPNNEVATLMEGKVQTEKQSDTYIAYTPLSRQFDTTREEIVERFRERIANQSRTKLQGHELEELIDIFLTYLTSLDKADSIKEFCDREIALLEEGYPVATVAKNYLPKYRKAISLAIDEKRIKLTDNNSHIYTYFKDGVEQSTREHYALTYLKYDLATYEQLARSTTRNNNLKQDSLQPVNLDLYLEQVRSLLSSPQPLENAIAIAAVTGRRYSEVMAKGHFTATEHPYQLYFEGQLKKRTPDAPSQGAGGRSKERTKDGDDGYLIYTLVPAPLVKEAHERFRSHPDIACLEDASIEEINKLNTPINRLIKQYFQDTNLIPILTEEAGVTIQNLRGIYGEISVRFFCPPSMGVHRFIQQKLGHLISDPDLASLKNSGSTEHYFHYYLVDSDGQPLSNKGVLLSEFSSSQDIQDIVHTPAPVAEEDNPKETTVDECITTEEIKQNSDLKAVTENSHTSSMNTIPIPNLDRSNYLKAIQTLIKNDDYRYSLVGLMAASGLNAASLLKLLVFKQAAAPHLILYCQQLHPSYLPLQQLLVLVDSQLFMDAIGNLRRNGDAINFSYPLNVEEIDRAVAEFIPDVLSSVGLPKDLDLVQQYQNFLLLLFENFGVEAEEDALVEDLHLDKLIEENQELKPFLTPLKTLVERLDAQQLIINRLAKKIDDNDLVFSSIPPQLTPANSNGNAISYPKKEVLNQSPSSLISPKKPKKNQLSPQHEKINRCIDAIMEYNNAPGRLHEDKWMISISILMQLADSSQVPVYAVYNPRKQEIDAHNELHNLGRSHNRKGGDFEVLLQEFKAKL